MVSFVSLYVKMDTTYIHNFIHVGLDTAVFLVKLHFGSLILHPHAVGV